MTLDFALRFGLVFSLSAIGDVFWTLYFIEVGNRNAVKAAFWSALIMLVAGVTILNYMHSSWLMLASVTGAFLGTYLTVKFKKP